MASEPKTILLVDDDPDVIDALRIVLEKHGYRVVSAASAEEGMLRYREAAPQLIIADLMMEEVDSGTGFVRELKLEGNTAPVYLLSSVGNALHGAVDYASLGLAGVFQKPIDPPTLIAVVRSRIG
jgi:CheY-like chemotaxis protein